MENAGEKRGLLGYDIDFDYLVRRVVERKALVFGVIITSFILAIVYLHLVIFTYTSTLMVSPVASSSPNIAGKLGNLGGLASLAGLNVGTDTGTQAFMLYQEGLYSRDVADELSARPDIMHAVFTEQWDEDAKRWVQPQNLRARLVQLAKYVLGVPNSSWHPPDGALLQDYIAANVRVDVDPEKPIVTVTFRNRDPKFAVKFLNVLNRAVDNKIRSNALLRVNQYIDYLSDQLNKVTNTDIRESLMVTLSDQEKTKMMASATAPYAAEPFGLPSASRKADHPNPMIILAIALVSGLLLGILAAVKMPIFHWPSMRFRKRVKAAP